MTRNFLPAEDCVFRLDYRDKFRQAFPMTFNNVGLSEDGFVFDGSTSSILASTITRTIWTIELELTIILNTSEETICYLYQLSPWNYIWITKHPDNRIRCKLYDGTNVLYVYSSSAIASDGAYHIEITNDGTQLIMYIDGVPSTPVANTYVPDTSIIRICSTDSTFSEFVLRMCNIYNVCHTAVEVLNRFNEVTFNVE